MNILSYHTRHIGRSSFSEICGSFEEGIQTLGHLLSSSERFYQTFQIVGSEPCVLPSIAFTIVIGSMFRKERIERCAPTAISSATSHKLSFFVKELSPTVTTISKELFIVIMSKRMSCIGYGCIGNSVFHIVGTGFLIQVTRDISIFLAQILSALVKHHRSFTGFVGSLFVKTINTFNDSLSHGNHTWITHHTICLVAHKMPHRQFSLFIVNIEHRVHHIRTL